MDKYHHDHAGHDVDKMFNGISGSYDFLNHFLSLSIDRLWRRKLLNIIKSHNPDKVLDIATGTGDMLILMKKAGIKKLHGIDPSETMLSIAGKKVKKRKIQSHIKLHHGYAENLPFPPESFDFITTVFGVRNFDDLQTSLQESMRVLKPQGHISILEFSMPAHPLIRNAYLFYLNKLIPFVGACISGDKTAYKYLSRSIQLFAEHTDVPGMLGQSGFHVTQNTPLFFGVARIYTAVK